MEVPHVEDPISDLLFNEFHSVSIEFQFGYNVDYNVVPVDDHVTKVIRFHPKYFEHHVKTHRYLMYDDGPLPFATRHYLAIIAAARNKCNYLVNLHEKEFLAEGGDVKWLNGLEFIPPKLRAIYDINKILAHRPWLLTKEHIERLTKTFCWSLAEVVHAIVILAHFHSLSSFVFSCGLNQELDASLKNELESSSPSLKEAEVEEIKPSTTPPFVQRLKLEQQRMNRQMMLEQEEQQRKVLQMNNQRQQQQVDTSVPSSPDGNIESLMKRMQDLKDVRRECSESELSNRFKTVEMQAASLTGSAEQLVEVPPSISHYVDDPNYTYQDFARRGAENIPHTFRVQDYSWDDHGYSLVNRLYNDVGFLLDDKFRVAYNLTYKTLAGRQNVDTSKFRRSIWNYIQCLYGESNALQFTFKFADLLPSFTITQAFVTTITITAKLTNFSTVH